MKKASLSLSARLVLIFLMAFMLLPICLSLFSSLLPQNIIRSLYGDGEGLALPISLTLCQYKAIFFEESALTGLLNTALLSFSSLLVQMPLALIIAFCLSRLRGFFFSLASFVVVLLMLMPNESTLLPAYMLIRIIGLDNSLAGLILPSAFSSFIIFILRQSLCTIPSSCIEAARLDTDSFIVIMLRIATPLIAPVIMTASLLSFSIAFSAIEQPLLPLLLLKSPALFPLSLQLARKLSFSFDYSKVFALSSVLLLPLLIASIPLRRIIIKGLKNLSF